MQQQVVFKVQAVTVTSLMLYLQVGLEQQPLVLVIHGETYLEMIVGILPLLHQQLIEGN